MSLRTIGAILSSILVGLRGDDVGGTLRSQKSDMVSIQNQIDSMDGNQLSKGVNQNTNILTSLRQAGSIMDGTSDIHKNVSAQSSIMAGIRADIKTNQIPNMQAGLREVQSTMISQHNSYREMEQNAIASMWKKLDSSQFKPFTSLIRNQTISVIKNISIPINQIENFDNQTTPLLNSTVLQADQTLNTSVTSALRSLQLVVNQLEYLQDQIPLLTNILEPEWENSTQTDVYNAIESEYQRYVNTSKVTVGGDAQNQVDLLFNNTYLSLYSSLNRTRDTLMSTLQDATYYSSQMIPVDQMTTVNNEFVGVIASIEAMLRDKLSVFAQRKAFLLNQVQPTIAGLGNTSSDLQTRFNTAVAQMESQLNSTRDSQYPKLDQFGKESQVSFGDSLNSTYNNILSQARARVATVGPFGDSRLVVLNQTLENLLQRAGPRIEDMRESMAVIAGKAKEAFGLAEDAINKTKTSTLSQIESRFKSTLGDINDKLSTAESDANSSRVVFKASMNNLNNLISSSNTHLRSEIDTRVHSLIASRTDHYKTFNSSVHPVPVISGNVVSGSNETVTRLEDSVNEFEKSLSNYSSSFSKTELQSVVDAFNRLQIDSFKSSLKSQFMGLLGDAKNNAQNSLAIAVANYSSSSDSLDSQLNSFTNLIERTIQAFENTTVKQSSWTPSTDITSIQTAVAALVDAATRSRMSVASAADRLASEYGRNISSDDASIDDQITAMLAAEKSKWMTSIESALDANNSRGAIADVLTGVKTELSQYSENGSQYRRMVQQAKDHIDSLDQDMKSGKQTLEPAYSDLSRLADNGLVDLSVEFAQIANSAPAIAGDSSRIAKMRTAMNAAIDKTVNDTKRSISDRLKTNFFKTEDAVRDYVDYINGSLSTVQQSSLAERDRVAFSHMELGNITRLTQKIIDEGLEAEIISHLKSVKVHSILNREATNLVKAIDSEGQDARSMESTAQSNSLLVQSDLMKDLLQVASWFAHRLQVFNSTVTQETADRDKLLEARQRLDGHRIGSSRKRAQNDLSGVIDSLDKTELFEDFSATKTASESLENLEDRAHDVFRQVIHAINATASSVGRESQKRYTDILKKFGPISTEVGLNIPNSIKSELAAGMHDLHRQGDNIFGSIQSHVYPAFDLKSEIDKLYYVTMLGDIVSENRRGLLRKAAESKKPKDFSEDIDSIRNEIKRIRDKVRAGHARMGKIK
jgi:hypothetical protein